MNESDSLNSALNSEGETDDEYEDDVKNDVNTPEVTFITDFGYYFSIHRTLLERISKVIIKMFLNFFN